MFGLIALVAFAKSSNLAFATGHGPCRLNHASASRIAHSVSITVWVTVGVDEQPTESNPPRKPKLKSYSKLSGEQLTTRVASEFLTVQIDEYVPNKNMPQ
jgi:hypothetical protein